MIGELKVSWLVNLMVHPECNAPQASVGELECMEHCVAVPCYICEANGGGKPGIALDDGSADAQCEANFSAQEFCSPSEDSMSVES